jgi:hypothetical protein
MAGGNIGDSRVNNFCRGGSKIKDQDWQKILFYLYSAGIFSGILFEMQNGLPSRMYKLSITQGVPDSFQVSTTHGVPDSFQVASAKDPSNYEVNYDAVTDSIQLATANNSSNENMDNSDNSNLFQCDIMPSSSDEGETASIKYLKRNHDPSLRYWEDVAFFKTERALNNSCIQEENFYRGNKKMHVHKQRSKIYKLGIFKKFNLAHLKYLESMKNPRFDYSTNEESNDLGIASSFLEDDEDMLMAKSLDYKLRARKASDIISESFKIEKKKAWKVIFEQPVMEGSSKHCQILETDSS